MHLEIEEARSIGIPILKVMEQESGFITGTEYGREKTQVTAKAPTMAMAVGMS